MDLRKEFDALKADSLAIFSKAKGESRPLTDEEKADTEKKFGRMSEIENLLKDEARFFGRSLPEAPAPAVAPAVVEDAVKALATASPMNFNRETDMTKTDNVNDSSVKAVEAVKHFGRTGEKKDFALLSTSGSGVLIPKSIPGVTVVRSTTNAIRRGFAALGIAAQINSSSTENVSIPVFNDVSNFGTTNAEGLTCSPHDATISAGLNLNMVEYHSEPQWISKKLVNANDFDITAAMVPAAQSRNERQEEVDWIATLAAAGTSYVTSSAAVTVNGQTALFAWQDVNNFLDSLSPIYEGLPKFIVCSQGFRTALKNMADSQNRPILADNVFGGVPTLNGVPVVASVNLPALAAGAVVAYLVVVTSGYDGAIIRDTPDSEVLRYENVPCYAGQIGIEAVDWSAFNVVPSAVKAFKIHA